MKNKTVTMDEMMETRKAATELAMAVSYNGPTTTDELSRIRKQAQEVVAMLQNLEAKAVRS